MVLYLRAQGLEEGDEQPYALLVEHDRIYLFVARYSLFVLKMC